MRLSPNSNGVNGGLGGIDSDYDYRLPNDKSSSSGDMHNQNGSSHHEMPPLKPPTHKNSNGSSSNNNGGVDGEEALLDLAQLEELHQEAERMKALGNKHMAAQEYTRAYNAYSAALQLSPVGPSSHVFLSNRAAALLSLKRYSAAATDARRAVALAPTFGKAHARLGQALYFLKDYAGAVAAYEDAIQYEPDNQVTQTYLEKAKTKLAKQHDKAQRYARGEDVSIAESSVQHTVVNSIASDPNASAAIVSGEFQQGNTNAAIANAIARKNQRMRFSGGIRAINMNNSGDEEDPDFDEALNIQKRANRFLADKHYKQAIEEYTAALFLVPDDPNLSPQLHLGRAHALNGSRRHASARNDATLAIRIKPSAEAYSTLAKSLFYLKEFEEAVEAFDNTMKMLPEGETLSQFDQAYLQKASAAVAEAASNPSLSPRKSPNKSSPIPKLAPPRFVPREQAINSTPNLPPMPKQWPQQSPRSPSALRCGPEREIVFFSESLGIKLNRGPDGIVRVLSVTKETPASPVARKGDIHAGDVIREAAGVDIRRPITNIMWGDTVALIRLSPRPITLLVAKELSEVPGAVQESRRLAEAEDRAAEAEAEARMAGMRLQGDPNMRPSPASGDEPVADSQAAQPHTDEIETINVENSHTDVNVVEGTSENVESVEVNVTNDQDVEKSGDSETIVVTSNTESTKESETEIEAFGQDKTDVEAEEDGEKGTNQAPENEGGIESRQEIDDVKLPSQQPDIESSPELRVSLRDEESTILGGEVFFPRAESEFAFCGWDNLRWMSYAGARKVQNCLYVEKLVVGDKKGLNIFGFGTASDDYVPRKLVIYEEPSLILLLRNADADELREVLDLPAGSELDSNSLTSFLIVDAAVEPRSCKLRLSPLTTPTSVEEEDSDLGDFRRRSCFQLLSPTGTIALTAIAGKRGVSYTDSSAFLETTTAELAISKAICQAHSHEANPLNTSWKHQMILGTLHSYVVGGSQKLLEKAIITAMKRSNQNVTMHGNGAFLHARIVDRLDDSALTPLHYACFGRFSLAVALLVKAGARVDIATDELGMTPIHLCAQNVDHQSLSILLAANFPRKPDPNALDNLGRTPMYVAAMDGRGPNGQSDPASLGRCMMALEAWGGKLFADRASTELRWPQSILAAQWRSEELSELLRHSSLRYPLPVDLVGTQVGISISALYQYPLHSALISMITEIQSLYEEGSVPSGPFSDPLNNTIVRTVLTLVHNGFEVNERIDSRSYKLPPEFNDYIGFSPLQILACAALEADNLKGRVNEGLLACILKVLSSVCDALLRSGARLSLDSPPTQRVFAAKSEATPGSDSDGPIIDAYDRTSLKVESNKQVVALLGGKDRVNESTKSWQEVKAAPKVSSLPFEHESAYEEKLVAGGCSEKSCAICWSEFGSIMNRKHRCRLSQRFVCDECSSKRVSHDGSEVRVSDGQHAVARAENAAADREKSQKVRAENEAQISKMKQAHEKARQSRLDEEAQRDSLFGNVMEKAAKMLGGEDDAQQPAAAVNDQVGGLTESLGQTRNALLDRGQKLEGLGEKTSQMVDSSAEFARMAKELQRQSNSWW